MIPDRPIPPASLQELGAHDIPTCRDLALAILERWENLTQGVEPIFRWPVEGDFIRWEEGQGACLGWEPDGRLKVATDRGIQRLSVGDVRGLAPEAIP
jgi:hypothetical protein